MKRQIYFLWLFISLASHAQYKNLQSDKIDIKKYTFQISINDENDLIKGIAKIDFNLLQPVDKLILNLKNKNFLNRGMLVSQVIDLKGTELPYIHEKDSLIIQIPDSITSQHVEIVYSGIPLDGLYIKNNLYGKRTFFGDNWPNRAQNWLPVIDHPSDKALVEWIITAPKHYEVIASGRLTDKLNLNDNYIYLFKTQAPIATKVMVMAAADFQIKYPEILHLHDQCIPLSYWIYADAPLTAFDDFQNTPEILKFYDSINGPYPYQKLANLQSNTRFGGMENAGNIFYDENKVNGLHKIENLVAHEIAHQWFGNSVTEKNWRDIWLSEGFATYMTDLYLEHKYGRQRLIERMKMERDKVIGYNLFNPKPVVYDEKENLMKLLNPNSYEKGAWVLHMLRQKTGDSIFFDILHNYYEKYRDKNASTEDFIEVAEYTSDMDLQEFFNQWLYKAGVPEIKISHELINKKILINIEQINDSYELELPVLVRSGENQLKKILHITRKYQEFSLPLPKDFDTENLQIEFDPEAQVLFRLIR